MPTKTLAQVVAYISPDLKKQMEQDRRKADSRISVSSYIESVLRKHLARKERKSI